MPEPLLWTPQVEGLALLESDGGPFERRAFREAYVGAMPGARDLSYAAAAPDGTLAAVALIARGRAADSVPTGYGGVRSGRQLSMPESRAFLRAARRAGGASSLTVRALELERAQPGARRFASASIVDVSGERRYSRLARRSLHRATQAGATVFRSGEAAPFFELYRVASTQWRSRYPESLVERLAAIGAGVFHHVELDGEVAASLFTLVNGTHWMCLLAAQSERGRAVAASYLAYDAVFEDARAAVEIVNLGASAPGSGGAQFKAHLGAVEAPMVAWRDAVPWWPAAQAVAAQIRGLRSRFS